MGGRGQDRDKVDSKDKDKAEDQIKELKEALEGDDIDDIKAKTEALNETAMALATKVYEEAAKENQNAETEEEEKPKKEKKSKKSKKDDDVVDADYEEK